MKPRGVAPSSSKQFFTPVLCLYCWLMVQGNAELHRDKLRRLAELGATLHNSRMLQGALSQQTTHVPAKPPLPDKTGKPPQNNSIATYVSTTREALSKLEIQGSMDPSAIPGLSDEELKGLLDKHRRFVADLEKELTRRHKC